MITIKPAKRILATNPYPQNPLGIQVHVSDAEAREAVNKLSGEPWVNIGFRLSSESKEIIKADKLEGFFTYNPCFEMADVIAAIESALIACTEVPAQFEPAGFGSDVEHAQTEDDL